MSRPGTRPDGLPRVMAAQRAQIAVPGTCESFPAPSGGQEGSPDSRELIAPGVRGRDADPCVHDALPQTCGASHRKKKR
jgi:hypothetical protein